MGVWLSHGGGAKAGGRVDGLGRGIRPLARARGRHGGGGKAWGLGTASVVFCFHVITSRAHILIDSNARHMSDVRDHKLTAWTSLDEVGRMYLYHR